MNPYNIIALILAIAGTAVNVMGTVRRHSAAQSLGTFLVMISVVMALVNEI